MRRLQSNLFSLHKAHCSLFGARLDAVKRWIHFGQTMTSQEVATALRPFIFIVHPDRFWKFPKEKNTNEVSLKRLNEFLGDRLNQKMTSNEETITFYVRNEDKSAQTSVNNIQLKKVDIKLSSRENLNTTVHRILKECSLPTDYLKKIGKQPDPKQASAQQHGRDPMDAFYRRAGTNEYFYNKDLFDEMEGKIAKSKMEVNLTDWLKSNYLSALNKLEASRPIETELIRLKEELINDLGLVNLSWNCDWGVSHIRGCLKNLVVLGKQHPEELAKLRGKTVIFSRNCGIGLGGQVVLSIEDVRSSWLDLIRSIKDYDPFVDGVPLAEADLSDHLRGISIVQANNNVLIAKKYTSQLHRFTKTIAEYSQKNGFPVQWPKSLAEYRLIVESDAGPLMLSNSGYFIVPASCPASLFVRFISENLHKASQTLKRDEENLSKEKRLMDECLVTFGLAGLEKDENIIPEQMVDFCQRLLKETDAFRPFLSGLTIRVSMYYQLQSDGQICVPFNFIARA